MVAAHTAEEFIKQHIDLTYQSLFVLSNVRKLERVGDQTKNIAEEIIFYLEAKVLKHSGPPGNQ
jgi:phosphate transport system protein